MYILRYEHALHCILCAGCFKAACMYKCRSFSHPVASVEFTKSVVTFFTKRLFTGTFVAETAPLLNNLQKESLVKWKIFSLLSRTSALKRFCDNLDDITLTPFSGSVAWYTVWGNGNQMKRTKNIFYLSFSR